MLSLPLLCVIFACCNVDELFCDVLGHIKSSSFSISMRRAGIWSSGILAHVLTDAVSRVSNREANISRLLLSPPLEAKQYSLMDDMDTPHNPTPIRQVKSRAGGIRNKWPYDCRIIDTTIPHGLERK